MLPFLYNDMNAVSRLLANFSAYLFEYADNIADRAVRVFNSHIDDAAVIWLAIEGSVDFYSAFTKLNPDVVRKRYIRAASAGGGGMNHGVVVIDFSVHFVCVILSGYLLASFVLGRYIAP